MTPQQAIPRSNTGVARLVRSTVRVILAVVVLVAVSLAWLALFLMFLPFLVVAEVIRLITGHDGEHESHEPATVAVRRSTATPKTSISLIFDRRNDVSKLYGCNTRNVRYRWELFKKHLDVLQREFEVPTALDFGAGSLRDSYELALRGFKVVSFDLNEGVLNRYFESYDWSQIPSTPTLKSGSLDDLVNLNSPNSVHLIIAFDVIEHLSDPSSYVNVFQRVLCERGFLFTIVPNRRSLFEKYFKHSLAKSLKKHLKIEPGVPHVQFKSPEEWEKFFEANGFQIIEHDMTVGHFVNDWWNGLLAIPLRTFVYPVLEVIAYYGKFELNAGSMESILCPRWLMERVNVLDEMLKPWIKGSFGWNLIVAQKLRDHRQINGLSVS